MGNGRSEAPLREIHRLFDAGTVSGLSDSQLLERFVTGRDEVAFATLVTRHGPMVNRVCREVLKDSHDAEDAFQATFLVLARKARTLWVRGSLASWLYRVAIRIAVQAKVDASRRRLLEQRAAEIRPAGAEPARSDLLELIQEEVDRLPERYREPVVLCHWEGLSHEAAAHNLRCPVGTVHGRLSRARDLLRKRLGRRGVVVPAGMLFAVMSQAGSAEVPSSLAAATVRAAIGIAMGRVIVTGGVSMSVIALVHRNLRSMIMSRFKGVAALALGLAGTTATVGVVSQAATRSPSAPARVEASASPNPINANTTAVEAPNSDVEARTESEKQALVEKAVETQDDNTPPRKASVEAPAISGIKIDGDLKDWPAAMPRYPLKHLHNLPPYYGFNGLEGADLSTSADLSIAFSVGYDPKDQVIYLAVIVRDDKLVVGNINFWDTDAIEVYVDGRHTEDSLQSLPNDESPLTVDAGSLPVLQYIGLPGKGPVYGVTRSAGEERGPDNPILMFGDIKKTKTRMAFRREGDVTTYEWALQAFDHYPDMPTQLTPSKKIGFDLAIADKDKPAATDGPATEPEDDRVAWITWSPDYQGLRFLNAGQLGEIILGRIPEVEPAAGNK
jgi:RNA polymerase sigma factor (sigma-70 family)